MSKQFEHETLIITKEAYFKLRNIERMGLGYPPLTPEQQESMWKRKTIKNGGANPATNPIADNEVRIDPDTFNAPWADIKARIDKLGLECRDDHFKVVGFYL